MVCVCVSMYMCTLDDGFINSVVSVDPISPRILVATRAMSDPLYMYL